jgi:putative colanic acid biosynthesis acetyltransferase WcaF
MCGNDFLITDPIPRIFENKLTLSNKAARALWSLAYLAGFRISATPLHFWRRFLLRLFGATIGPGAHIYPRARIWAPWNLRMGAHSCIANDVDCYCVAKIEIGDYALVSQYSFLCTATHDYESGCFDLIFAPIKIGGRAWIAADAFIGPGVSIGEGAVIGARSTITKDVPAWSVWVGCPARRLKSRRISR